MVQILLYTLLLHNVSPTWCIQLLKKSTIFTKNKTSKLAVTHLIQGADIIYCDLQYWLCNKPCYVRLLSQVVTLYPYKPFVYTCTLYQQFEPGLYFTITTQLQQVLLHLQLGFRPLKSTFCTLYYRKIAHVFIGKLCPNHQ